MHLTGEMMNYYRVVIMTRTIVKLQQSVNALCHLSIKKMSINVY